MHREAVTRTPGADELTGLFAAPARNAIPAHPTPLGHDIRWMFEAGLPDPATYPVEDLRRIMDDVLATEAAEALGYGTAFDNGIHAGFVGLRDALAERGVRIDGRALDRHNVMLTSGAAHALMLLFEAFLDPGDVAAVEAPTWNAVIAALARRGTETIALPVDDEGLDVDRLEEELERLARRRAPPQAAVHDRDVPHAGRRLPLAPTTTAHRRARRSVGASSSSRTTSTAMLRYDGDAIPTMFSLDDDEGFVIKVDSFSKVVAPGLRVGWITAPAPVLATLAGLRGDLGVSQFTARVLAHYVNEGSLEPHIADVNALYRAKRNTAEAALRRYCGEFVRWRTPDGGFFLWVELDERVDPSSVMRLALERGVSCRAGERFFGDGDQGRNFFRLAFPSVPIDEIDAGIAVVGDAVTASLHA